MIFNKKQKVPVSKITGTFCLLINYIQVTRTGYK